MFKTEHSLNLIKYLKMCVNHSFKVVKVTKAVTVLNDVVICGQFCVAEI
jgi:hypothetical protein